MDETSSEREKQQIADALRGHLRTAKTLRLEANSDAVTAQHRLLLREWQAARLARTHADLLASPRFGRAAKFFLSDLYGPKDFSGRDEEVERILPTLIGMLPVSALRAIGLAVEVDALTESLDSAMVTQLHLDGSIKALDDDAYAAAYRCVGGRNERERQLMLIRQTGETLDAVARKPLLGTLLKLMRGPAQLAGLLDLHGFLDTGLTAFRHMGSATEFLNLIDSREKRVLQQLYAGCVQPFRV